MKNILYVILLLIMVTVSVGHAEVTEFILQSSDSGTTDGQHGGRPYHVLNGDSDEAVYLSASDWQGGHHPEDPVVWPLSDGFISWPTIDDPNGTSGRPEAYTLGANDTLQYLYYNKASGEYELHTSPDISTDTLVKQSYAEGIDVNGTLNFGNDGREGFRKQDCQHALITEFKLNRPYLSGMAVDNLISARLELTIDDVVDMTLSGHNGALTPSKLFVNAFTGDGIVGIYENAQADFDRIDPNSADAFVWMTIGGEQDDMAITDFTLSYYKLIISDGEPYTFQIDVTDSFISMLEDDADFAGFILSGSSDGDYTLTSFDLVDSEVGKSYLPKLIITADVDPLISDFDENYRVDLSDFVKLSSVWLCEDTDDNYDIVYDISDPVDGVIDINDFAVFAVQWLVDRNRN